MEASFKGKLFEFNIPFIQPDRSEYIGTPTSSYRSWAIRRVVEKDNTVYPEKDSIPFIVKLGVSSAHDSTRLLSECEVKRSIQAQVHFNQIKIDPGLFIFQENFGLCLKNIPRYPPATITRTTAPIGSGIIIREFPEDLLQRKCKIFSFSALMSLERLKHTEKCVLNPSVEGRLPIIYEIINNAIDKGIVQSSEEFIRRYLIFGILHILEGLIFEEGMSLALHGQNLCMVLNNENLPIGIAIRDHGDIHRIERYLETYTWFYRYHVFIKLMNVMTVSTDYFLPAISGVPVQIGFSKSLKERSLNYYLQNKINKNSFLSSKVQSIFKKISIDFKEYRMFLEILDHSYLSLLSKYFNLEGYPKLRIGNLPSAETGSSGERKIYNLNKKLWKSKK